MVRPLRRGREDHPHLLHVVRLDLLHLHPRELGHIRDVRPTCPRRCASPNAVRSVRCPWCAVADFPLPITSWRYSPLKVLRLQPIQPVLSHPSTRCFCTAVRYADRLVGLRAGAAMCSNQCFNHDATVHR